MCLLHFTTTLYDRIPQSSSTIVFFYYVLNVRAAPALLVPTPVQSICLSTPTLSVLTFSHSLLSLPPSLPLSVLRSLSLLLQMSLSIGLGGVLAAEMKKRIMVLDGAMGTMIQSYHLTEEQFRGVCVCVCVRACAYVYLAYRNTIVYFSDIQSCWLQGIIVPIKFGHIGMRCRPRRPAYFVLWTKLSRSFWRCSLILAAAQLVQCSLY